MSNNQTKKNGKGPQINKRMAIIYLLLGLVLCGIFYSHMGNLYGKADELPTSGFVAAVKQNRVLEANFSASNGTLKGRYWEKAEDVGDNSKLKRYTSTYVGSDSLAELMAEHKEVVYKVDVKSNALFMGIISTVIPILLIAGIMVYFMRQMAGQNSKSLQFGKTKARQTEENRPKVKFSDVAGVDEAVDELQEIKDFLSNPAKFQGMGAKIPRGVLLVGPPGTGKTLLAKAVAGEAGVPFFSISGSDFVEMFVGVGASRVRDLFAQAKEAAPAIIFIDEIDAVGRQRGAGLGGGHDEREQTLNQLLVEMDGFEPNDSVILIAATNRPDILDPALLRPGRFDRQVTVDRPDVKGREKILRVHAEGKPLDKSIKFETIAQLTPGFTGADLANLMNESALLTARRNKKKISMDEITEAMERVIAGPERKSRVISEKEKNTIAYHEAGHALVGHVLEHSDPVHKISIIARGQALGYTLSMPAEDRFLVSKKEILDDLAVFLAGRVAEEIACDDITTGASNDLERATKMARELVTRYGMSDNLGTQAFGQPNHEVFLGRDYGAHQDYSPKTAERIDDEVSRIMKEAHDRAHEILEERRPQLDLMVSVLLERETIEGEAVKALLDNKWDEYLSKEKELEDQKQGQEEELEAADKSEHEAPEDESVDESKEAVVICEHVVNSEGLIINEKSDGSVEILHGDKKLVELPSDKTEELETEAPKQGAPKRPE